MRRISVHGLALCGCLATACGATQEPRATSERTLALGLTSSLPDTIGPVRWTLYIDRHRVWAGEASSEPVAVEVGIPPVARTIQLSGEADGTSSCASSFVHVELSRVLYDGGAPRLDVELATDANGVVRLRSDQRGMSHAEDVDAEGNEAPPAGATDEQLADFMADLLLAARRTGDLSALACVRRRVDEATALMAGRRTQGRSRAAIGLSAEVTLEAPSKNARMRALASAAAQCPLHGHAPSVRAADSVEVTGPPRCGVRPPEARVSVDVRGEGESRESEQRYPGALPDIPRRSGEDTVEVTVERVGP